MKELPLDRDLYPPEDEFQDEWWANVIVIDRYCVWLMGEENFLRSNHFPDVMYHCKDTYKELHVD